MLLEPDDETRDKLLTVIYKDDPQPPFCPHHGDSQGNRRTCTTCNTMHLWYRRMRMRFNRQGFQFRKPQPPALADPRPPACPKRHAFTTHFRVCDACRLLHLWDTRRYAAERRAGQVRTTDDIAPIIAHLELLERGGLVTIDIAEQSGVNETTIYEIRNGERTRVFKRSAEAILSVPVPDRSPVQLIPDKVGARRPFIDATGTRRRIAAARLNGHSIAEQAERLGWPKGTVRNWAVAKVVHLFAADAVASLYPKLIETPGTNHHAASLARTEGQLPARCFSEANIDDPTYDPTAVIEKPWAVWRMLSALAWLGHGPEEVAAEIDEPAAHVRSWMMGGAAPAYAKHLVIPVYERWSFTQGLNRQAADLARRLDWASPLAWDDIDLDEPNALPRVGLPANFTGKSKLVLTSAVFDAIDGKIPVSDLVPEEKVKVVTVLHRRGWSDRRIAAWLRWHEDPDLGAHNVAKFRERYDIHGFGVGMHGLTNADDGLIIFGAAA